MPQTFSYKGYEIMYYDATGNYHIGSMQFCSDTEAAEYVDGLTDNDEQT